MQDENMITTRPKGGTEDEKPTSSHFLFRPLIVRYSLHDKVSFVWDAFGVEALALVEFARLESTPLYTSR
jgi:hypothetical protein